MLSVACVLKAKTPAAAAARAFANFYSTVSGLSERDWKLGGIPAPKSLAADALPKRPASEQPITLDSLLDGEGVPLRHEHWKTPTAHEFAEHRRTMKKAFPDGWAPPRKLSRETMDAVRAMHALDPRMFTTPVLAEKFRVSPEAIRRILKSKWEPTKEVRAKMAERARRSREEWLRARREEERRIQRELEKESGQIRVKKGDKLSLT
ncbi:hypothetical protein WOLCODRAFT_139830 [Wolfiporia cocos MD-104 SS10]|uniref:Required for respiratory growth protein 9, mitochondrial n=1 Tax=Wolfiporia cocos (strain MD-104) TaxID=742152 RepID=A0A2H3JC62_WOLCO|nr:hypothetical protein WOLCODRAFT_139830 [Wolfiporia cocos MD-104 SS10]